MGERKIICAEEGNELLMQFGFTELQFHVTLNIFTFVLNQLWSVELYHQFPADMVRLSGGVKVQFVGFSSI